jgi:hypothetical protein
MDFIMSRETAVPRRVAPNILQQGTDSPSNLQYVLHTTDEYSTAGTSPSHAIAFRTIDTETMLGSDDYGGFGGAKLGIYSFWGNCSTCPSTAAGYPQYEFYNYYNTTDPTHAANTGELGNEGVASVSTEGETTLTTGGLPYSAQNYSDSFNSVVYSELYEVYGQLQSAYQTAFSSYMSFAGETQDDGGACPAPTQGCTES